MTPQWLFLKRRSGNNAKAPERESDEEDIRTPSGAPKWSFGVLNDKETIEVPGSVLLLSSHRNEPLGLRNTPARTSHSSIPTGGLHEPAPPWVGEKETVEKKKTRDGKIILEPQPEDSANDPLNWPAWRRDAALLCLGLYCMVGGGTTPLLAAGFTNVAKDYGVPVSRVSLTTGLFMMGLGLGSVVMSPTAILWGKRPVYLVSTVLFIVTSVWCAVSPNYPSLVVARIFQGIAVSPVECLPSASVAEIFFLHERAFRLGIYTLLLLGGKNLMPLVSAAIIQSLSWRWVFWIVALVVAICGLLVFVFVPETFWDRVPVPKAKTPRRPSFLHKISARYMRSRNGTSGAPHNSGLVAPTDPERHNRQRQDVHFSTGSATKVMETPGRVVGSENHVMFAPAAKRLTLATPESELDKQRHEKAGLPGGGTFEDQHAPSDQVSFHADAQPSESGEADGISAIPAPLDLVTPRSETRSRASSGRDYLPWSPRDAETLQQELAKRSAYSAHWRDREAKSFVQQLRPWNGRLNEDKWLKVVVRPFILYSYPSVLWSALVYSCSVGWLIVVSESVAVIYRQGYYQFNALQTGLIYISPFIGGILGTAVAGKVSDVIVKAMARRNGGLYEPEFRLVMVIPVALTTVIGLMGFGWSAQVRDNWIVPTVFFGIISFGCSLGSTSSITFCVDSYRQYAGEALVTLNFSKNLFHGLVFSLFVTEWLEEDGAKMVFIWIGVIQLVALSLTVPMFIYGKRARMWTVRKNFMERF